MPYTMLPPGYRAVLLGQSASIEELGAFAPLEYSSEEGALFLMRLDFTEFPTEEALSQLEQALQEAGVERWPGYDHIVHANTSQPTIYLVWQKGMAWMPIIVGLLATTVLPPLLTSLVWWVLPEDVRNTITGIIDMGMMLLMMFMMMQLMKPLTASNRTTKRVAKPKELNEVNT